LLAVARAGILLRVRGEQMWFRPDVDHEAVNPLKAIQRTN